MQSLNALACRDSRTAMRPTSRRPPRPRSGPGPTSNALRAHSTSTADTSWNMAPVFLHSVPRRSRRRSVIGLPPAARQKRRRRRRRRPSSGAPPRAHLLARTFRPRSPPRDGLCATASVATASRALPPPVVECAHPEPEKERTAMGEMLPLTAEDGHTLLGYRAAPQGKLRGALVIIQEIFGVNSHIKRLTDGFAADGYVALAPAIFDRAERDSTGARPISRSRPATGSRCPPRTRTLDFLKQYLG